MKPNFEIHSFQFFIIGIMVDSEYCMRIAR